MMPTKLINKEPLLADLDNYAKSLFSAYDRNYKWRPYSIQTEIMHARAEIAIQIMQMIESGVYDVEEAKK